MVNRPSERQLANFAYDSRLAGADVQLHRLDSCIILKWLPVNKNQTSWQPFNKKRYFLSTAYKLTMCIITPTAPHVV